MNISAIMITLGVVGALLNTIILVGSMYKTRKSKTK
jgi:hypothetical protein